MKPSRQYLRTLVFFVVLSVGACVTINIYFPAEKVESVAGEIVDDIRGNGPDKEEKPARQPQGRLDRGSLYAALVPVAAAQDVTAVSNPTIRSLKQSMKDRFPQLKPWFGKAVLKEGDDGYVAVANEGPLSVREKGIVRNLVAAENKDRQDLYREVAKALNIDPGQTDRVAAIFAVEWQKSLK
jgi:hypothetical protein